MNNKRVTIYDLAKEMGISASYISRALNNHPSINEKMKAAVKKKAAELNYKQNTHAANLRQGNTKTFGVIVPQINQSFFSEAISGIEEICFENNYNLIICQSHESFEQECKAVETLIHQNVDCILISVSAETKSSDHLKTIMENDIELIQFDRYMEDIDSYKVLNDNEQASYLVTKSMAGQGFKRIAFIGGPAHLTTFKNRKKGYLRAIQEIGLVIPYNFIVENVLYKQQSEEVIKELLSLKEPPDAFITVSDHQSLAILQLANSLGLQVPAQLGIFGFANEEFTKIIQPSLSSVDQKSKELGRCAASLYFNRILKEKPEERTEKTEIINADIIVRASSQKVAAK